MIRSNNNRKITALMAMALFVVTGTYNAIVINSESQLTGSKITLMKRLDELKGITVPGRLAASASPWKKLTPQQVVQYKKKAQPIVQTVSRVEAASSPEEAIPEPAIKEDLSMRLVEVINPKKWQQGLKSDQFVGSIETNNGVIESLEVSLPNGEGISDANFDLAGNVFKYKHDNIEYAGVMYQADQNAYMVNLTDGPLEGTRLRFAKKAPPVEQVYVQDTLAQNNNVEVGNFGENQPGVQAQVAPEVVVDAEQALSYDQQIQQESMQAQGYDMAQPAAM